MDPNKEALYSFFTEQGITYLETLEFFKPWYKDKIIAYWKGIKDPTKTFLAKAFQENLEKHLHPQVAIEWIDRKKRYGVMAEESLGTHAFVGECAGVVKKGSIKSYFSAYSIDYPLPFAAFRGFVIDLEKKGNFTRYINHDKSPNLELKSVITKDGLIRMICITKKPVRKGEELTLHYNTWSHFFRMAYT